MMPVLLAIAALIVLWKTIDVCAHIDINNFDGHPLHFCGMALYWALFGAGAVAVAAGIKTNDTDLGGIMLLLGLAVFCLVTRRRCG